VKPITAQRVRELTSSENWWASVDLNHRPRPYQGLRWTRIAQWLKNPREVRWMES